MKKRLFLTYSLSLFLSRSYAQEIQLYQDNILLQASYGQNFPITKFLTGNATDHLLEFDDYTNYVKFPSVTYFFSRHWGVCANLQFNYSGKIPNNERLLESNLNDEYGQQFFIAPVNLYSISSPSYKVELGMTYRFETKRFAVYPKFSLGIYSFDSNRFSGYLKQKNTNYVSSLTLKPNAYSKDFFSLTSCLSMSYRLSRRWAINLECGSSYFRTNIHFEKTISDIFTEKSNTTIINYPKNIFYGSLGAGLIFVLD